MNFGGLVAGAIACWFVVGMNPANVALAQLGPQCDLNSDCEFPLRCRSGRCRQQCESYRDCASGEICVVAPRLARNYRVMMCVDIDSYGEQIPPFMVGYNRPGNDIRAVPLPVFNPKLCHYVCKEEKTPEPCRFWTIVKPGAQENTAMCWLKRAPGTLQKNPNTVSSGDRLGREPRGSATDANPDRKQELLMKEKLSKEAVGQKELQLAD